MKGSSVFSLGSCNKINGGKLRSNQLVDNFCKSKMYNAPVSCMPRRLGAGDTEGIAGL